MIIPFSIVLMLGIIISLLHITGVALLTKEKDNIINGNQKYLIMALSLTEIGFVVLSITRESIFYASGSRENNAGLCVSLYMAIVIANMYYFVMFSITLDRLLGLRLNIKYPLYWNKNKTKNTLILVFLILNVAWTIILSIILLHRQYSMILKNHGNIDKMNHTYYAPVVDSIFVIFVVIVYSYIFSKLYKNRRKEEELRKQIKSNETKANNISMTNLFRVPFLIILSFIFFWIIPNILQSISYIYPAYQIYFHVAYYGLHRIGSIVDAIIYIVALEKVKVKKLVAFKKMVVNIIRQKLNSTDA